MASQAHNPNRRRKLLVPTGIQGALVRRLVLQWFLFFAVLLLALPLWHAIRTADFSRPFSEQMAAGLASSAPAYVLILAILPLFAYDTVKLSNRFAGPIYRIHKSLRALADGEPVKPIRLRRGDYCQELAADANRLVARLAAQPPAREKPRTAADADDEPAVAAGSSCGT